jgi:cell division protein FtsQ
MWHDVLALNRLTMLMVAIALALTAWTGARWLAGQPRFSIRAVVVEGADGSTLKHMSAERIARVCVPRISGTLFTADLREARHAFESLPWVRRASVRREWPDRLVVRLEEHEALGRWNDEGGNRFVSVKGEAFDAPGEVALGETLPLLSGPEGSAGEVARQYEVLKARFATIGKAPHVVSLSPRQAWTLRLADGLTVEVGREQPNSTVLSRVERFVTHYAATVGRMAARVEVVDLRYPNGFAARVPGFRAHAEAPAATAPKRKPNAAGARPTRPTGAPMRTGRRSNR